MAKGYAGRFAGVWFIGNWPSPLLGYSGAAGNVRPPKAFVGNAPACAVPACVWFTPFGVDKPDADIS